MSGNHTFKRSARLQELFMEEVSRLIQNGLKDPRLGSGLVTVTGVELTDNLKHGKIFVSILGNEEEKSDIMKGLTSATGYIRRYLGRNLYLKKIPELEFVRDDTAEQVDRISRLLNEIHHGERGH